MHGWEQAPYATKADTDANYKRCLDWVLTPERTDARAPRRRQPQPVRRRVGRAARRATAASSDRVEVEMLEGMAPAQAQAIRAKLAGSLLLYTPVVDPADFDVAISYLFRRLEENAAAGQLRAVARRSRARHRRLRRPGGRASGARSTTAGDVGDRAAPHPRSDGPSRSRPATVPQRARDRSRAARQPGLGARSSAACPARRAAMTDDSLARRGSRDRRRPGRAQAAWAGLDPRRRAGPCCGRSPTSSPAAGPTC